MYILIKPSSRYFLPSAQWFITILFRDLCQAFCPEINWITPFIISYGQDGARLEQFLSANAQNSLNSPVTVPISPGRQRWPDKIIISRLSLVRSENSEKNSEIWYKMLQIHGQLWCEVRNYCTWGSDGEIVALAPIIYRHWTSSVLKFHTRCCHVSCTSFVASRGLQYLINCSQSSTLGAMLLHFYIFMC